MTIHRRVWTTAAALLATVALAACGGGGSGEAQPTATVTVTETAAVDEGDGNGDGDAADIVEDAATDEAAPAKAEITGYTDEDLGGEVWREVEFSLTNTSGDVHDFNVAIEFLDGSGDRLGMAEVTLTKVKPGQTVSDSTPVELTDPATKDMKKAAVVEVYTVD